MDKKTEELMAKYPEVERFARLMLAELEANAHKAARVDTETGVRAWMQGHPETLTLEIYRHVAKLDVAVKDLALRRSHGRMLASTEAANVREHAADVAVCALILLDRLGELPFTPEEAKAAQQVLRTLERDGEKRPDFGT